MVLLKQDLDDALEPALSERVEALLHPYGVRPLLSTYGTQAAIAELAARTRGLERAMREITLEVEKLRASP